MAAAFNSGYGFGSADSQIFGGYAFETSSGKSAPAPKPEHKPVAVSALSRMEAQDRANAARQKAAPVPAPAPAPTRAYAPQPVERYYDTDFEDDFDDFDDFEDDFDDFEDDFGASDFDDFDDEPVYAPPVRQPQPRAAQPARRQYSELDEYFGRPMREPHEQREVPGISGQSRAPSWFEQLCVDDGRSAKAARSASNRTTSRAQRMKMRVLGIASGIAGAAAMVVLVVCYFTLIRVSEPLNVVTAFSSLTPTTAYNLMKPSIDETLSHEQRSITIDGTEFTFTLDDFDFALAVPGVTEQTSQIEIVGEDGVTEYQTLTCVGSVVFNETLVRDYLNRIAMEKGGSEMIEPYYEVRDDKLMVYAGTDGYGVEYDTFVSELLSRIKTGSTETISTQMVTTKASLVNIDEIYDEVACEAADASYTTDATGQMIWVDEVVGKQFDLEAARAAISVGGTAWTVQLTLTEPDIKLMELRAPYCLDEISQVVTEFSVTNSGRVANIARACEKIDGLKLNPGDQFSFNGVVGERLPSNGFCKATVYTSEGTDEDYGGGICQVSSTLYYAVVKANLQIDERHPHKYTVHYLESGLDATVNWGTHDLKFTNNREYPVTLKAYVKGGELFCEVYGTADGYTADLKRAEIQGSYVYPKTLYYHAQPGKSTQAGQMGLTVDTYRVVYFNGDEVSRKHEEESTYSALNQVYFTDSLPAGCTYSD